MLIIQIVTVPENHIDPDIRAFNYISYGLIGLALLAALIGKRFYSFIFATIFALASLGGVYYVDKNNLVVQYDEWTSRGMPEKGMPNRTSPVITPLRYPHFWIIFPAGSAIRK